MVQMVENIKLTHHLTSMSYELQKTSRNILKKLLISKLIETSLRAIVVNGSFRRMKFHMSVVLMGSSYVSALLSISFTIN
jgi:hypothetical protein